MLRKLGTREKDIKKSVLSQLLLYFGLPFSLACISGTAIITGMYRMFTGLTLWTRFQNILFASGLILFIYGIYFAATYVRSKQILHIE